VKEEIRLNLRGEGNVSDYWNCGGITLELTGRSPKYLAAVKSRER